MKKYSLILLCLTVCLFSLQSQILFQEDFEASDLPTGWTIQTNASDGGWVVGTPGQVSSQNWSVSSNGSSRVIASNDDDCNCDKSNDLLITPAIDLTGQDLVVVQFDLFFGAQSYQGVTEEASVFASVDGVNWELLEELHGHGFWDKHIISLNDYAGEPQVFIGFQYDDGGGWLYGIAIDNVSIEVPIALDAELVDLEARSFGEENVPFTFKGIFFNNGGSAITDLSISYSIGGGLQVWKISTVWILNHFPTSNWPFLNGYRLVPVFMISQWKLLP